MQLNPSEISELIKSKIEKFDLKTEARNEGTIISLTDGIVRIHGLEDAMSYEMLEFPGNTYGLALNLERDSVGAVVMGEYKHLTEGDAVKCTGRVLEVPVGEALLGRVVDALGNAIDGKGPVETTETSPLEKVAPGVITRKSVDQPEVSVVLSGMTTEQDLEDNLASADDACTGCLTAGERDMIARVTEEYRTRMKVLCTGCQYCMPCPAGVNIPECFNRYNMAFMFDNLEQARMTYPVFLKPGARASACVKCGACEEKCPQNLQIRALLDSVTELLEPKE